MKINQKLILVSPEDEDLKVGRTWHVDSKGYLRATYGHDTKVWLHQIILERMTGIKPGRASGMQGDHIYGNKLDNRRSELRLTTHAGNNQNRPLKIFRGTTWNKCSEKWQAHVGHRGKTYYLGLFTDRNKAAKVAENKRSELGFLGPVEVKP
jgi:hypothetical protein